MSGTVALPNDGDGVVVFRGLGNLVGGSNPSAANLISGNGSHDVRIVGSASGTAVRRNLIGTDVTGTAAIPNELDGVEVSSGGNTVGGFGGDGNLISGNAGDGVEVFFGGAVAIIGNRIGTDVSGAAPLANGTMGVRFRSAGSGSQVRSNTIAFNDEAGVHVDLLAGTGFDIRGNSIHSNGGLGIDLGGAPFGDGVTPNDPGDGDTGPNNLQNIPVPIDALAGSLLVHASLNSVPTPTSASSSS